MIINALVKGYNFTINNYKIYYELKDGKGDMREIMMMKKVYMRESI